jgi:8-oxo-dGTP pyrophosphatase MutT (NUDIX family)
VIAGRAMSYDPRLTALGRVLESRTPVRLPRAELLMEAAVAVVVRAASDVEILLIKRAEHVHDPWSGHMAFPGGRRHDSDRDLLETALRETEEETGVELRRSGELLGPLDEVEPRTHRLPPLVIAPYVLAVPPGGELRPDPAEVEAALWVPVAELLRPEAATTIEIDLGDDRLPFPCFRYHDFNIWGLTHRVLEQFLARWREAGA